MPKKEKQGVVISKIPTCEPKRKTHGRGKECRLGLTTPQHNKKEKKNDTTRN